MFQDLETKLYIGCDPGLSGALAVVDHEGNLVQIIDLPTMPDASKNIIDCVSLYHSLAELPVFNVAGVYLERVAPMPAQGTAGGIRQQGIASTGAFMKAAGMIEAVLRVTFGDDKITKIMPTQWKRRYDLIKGSKKIAVAKTPKHASVTEARTLFPGNEGVLLISKADRSEALLLANLAYIDSHGSSSV